MEHSHIQEGDRNHGRVVWSHTHLEGDRPHIHLEHRLNGWALSENSDKLLGDRSDYLPEFAENLKHKMRSTELLERLYNATLIELKFKSLEQGLKESQYHKMLSTMALRIMLREVREYIESTKTLLEDPFPICPECGSDVYDQEVYEDTTGDEYWPVACCTNSVCNWNALDGQN